MPHRGKPRGTLERRLRREEEKKRKAGSAATTRGRGVTGTRPSDVEPETPKEREERLKREADLAKKRRLASSADVKVRGRTPKEAAENIERQRRFIREREKLANRLGVSSKEAGRILAREQQLTPEQEEEILEQQQNLQLAAERLAEAQAVEQAPVELPDERGALARTFLPTAEEGEQRRLEQFGTTAKAPAIAAAAGAGALAAVGGGLAVGGIAARVAGGAVIRAGAPAVARKGAQKIIVKAADKAANGANILSRIWATKTGKVLTVGAITQGFLDAFASALDSANMQLKEGLSEGIVSTVANGGYSPATGMRLVRESEENVLRNERTIKKLGIFSLRARFLAKYEPIKQRIFKVKIELDEAKRNIRLLAVRPTPPDQEQLALAVDELRR